MPLESPLSEAIELEEVGEIELIVVGSRFTKNYRVGRELLETPHYLGSGPLAGHQLRYLIKGPQGWLGGLAFSAAEPCGWRGEIVGLAGTLWLPARSRRNVRRSAPLQWSLLPGG